jgi:hypothetical protein
MVQCQAVLRSATMMLLVATTGAQNVLDLNIQNFDMALKDSEVTLVKFYAPWYGRHIECSAAQATAKQSLLFIWNHRALFHRAVLQVPALQRVCSNLQ